MKLAFEALTIEGGLLSPDWLARVAALDAGSQSEADYRIPRGLQLRDEIGRYWRIAQAYWSDFAAGRASAITPEAAQVLSERFVLALLRESFGFASLAATTPLVIAERSYPIRFTALGGRVPVVIAPAGVAGHSLDMLAPAFGDGSRRRSAFGLAQEYLNAAESATWGLVTDGLGLRILRDNASLTRPAWIEADLARIFTEERYADFAALWLLAHETRFGRADQSSTECPLEIWRNAGREEGTRAREHLRRGVEDALAALGQGFLAHPENSALRARLQDGSLSPMGYFQELLRLVYRLIFLLTVEERGLLHPEGSAEEARRLYFEGYGLRRLRERSIRRSAHDRFSDLWESARIVFRGLAAGESRLALPALAGIFAPAQCPTLDAAKLENRALLLAIFRLSWLRETSGLARVNWRDMGPEELGSVYESLLELVPQVTQGGRFFAFATGGETKGNARKTSGSYYTPDSLVQVLLDSALEPVIASTLAANLQRPVEALLKLSVVDPACGSGHFLLAAARRLAGHVARYQANGTPSAAEYRHSLRQVVGRCLYGVDLNPMAVELCKVSLWMEAVEPGLPLTFLDAHIRHGNALLGTTPKLMADGIPDDAWSPIEGDDRKVASGLKNRNKRSKGGQRALDTLWTQPIESETSVVARAVAELEAAPDTDVEELARKEEQWDGLLSSEAYLHQKSVADAWCAAFVWPKQPGPLQDAAPTNDVWIQIRDRRGQPNALTVKTIKELAEQYRFFHWHLAFPQASARGGFDVVLGNPPWDRVTLEEKEWFASVNPEIATAATAAKRRTLIQRLASSEPALLALFRLERRRIDGEKAFLSHSGRAPLSAQGILNTYLFFVENALSLVSYRGQVGTIVPTGIATAKGAGELFRSILETGRLRSLRDLQNRKGIFPDVQRNMRFCLLTLSGRSGDSLAVSAQASDLNELLDVSRQSNLTIRDVKAVNPETHHLPLFSSKRDAEIVLGLYSVHPTIYSAFGLCPGRNVEFLRMLNTADDSEGFRPIEPGEFTEARASQWLPVLRTGESLWPLYESKLLDQNNHRAATFVGTEHSKRYGLHAAATQSSDERLQDPEYVSVPRYWVSEALLSSDLKRPFLLVYRDAVSAVADVRCLSATIVPWGAVGDTLKVAFFQGDVSDGIIILSVLNTFALDYVFRQKSSSSHASAFILRQLPIPQLKAFHEWPAWMREEKLVSWLTARQLELTYTAWDLQSFGRAAGYDGPPFRWDPERRFLLRAELDAAFFHLYGLSRDDTAYILDTFPIVRKNDEKAYGEYRTKRVILEIYDAMAEASRTGSPYETHLDPPPGDPRVAHPSRPDVVVKFPSRPFVLPAWGPGLFDEVAARAHVRLDAGVWGTSLSGRELGTAALAAVLGNLPGPYTRKEVERAVVLVLLPRLMLSSPDSTFAGTWRSLIGSENLKVTSVGQFEIPWSTVLREAILQNVLAEETDGRWRAGTNVADALFPEFEARALVALAWLAAAPSEDAEVTKQMENLYVA